MYILCLSIIYCIEECKYLNRLFQNIVQPIRKLKKLSFRTKEISEDKMHRFGKIFIAWE